MTISSDIGQFETWELEAYAEGVDMPTIEIFTRKYPDVWAAWLQNYQKTQQKYNILNRFDCPEPEQLRDYYWGFLPSAESEGIKRHIIQCPSCTKDLENLNASLAGDITKQASIPKAANAQPPLAELFGQVANQLRLIVANLVSPLTPTLSPAALRNDGSDSAATPMPMSFLFEAGDIGINISIRREGKDHISLSGQLFSTQTLENWQVKFIPQTAEASEIIATLNEVGEFSTNQLRPGYYQIIFTLSDKTVIIPNVLFDVNT